ncbi:MAG: hypothetical protein RJA70_4416 [Pseudomonadota bacterium]|jgi:hypothetical protein
MQEYLIVNGRVIAGEGFWTLRLGGRNFPGIRWIEWNFMRVRIGGDLSDLALHFSTRDASPRRRKSPQFDASLGFVAGEQRWAVSWTDCSFRWQNGMFAEFRARAFYEQRDGWGCGPRAYFREWIFRLNRSLTLSSDPIGEKTNVQQLP